MTPAEPSPTPSAGPAGYVAAILPLLMGADFVRATFGGATRFGKTGIKRVEVRPVRLSVGTRLQVSRFDGRKVLYDNHVPEELPAALADVFAAGFANVHVSTSGEEIDLRLTKKGDLLVGRKAFKRGPGGRRSSAHGVAASEVGVGVAVPLAHNRVKEVPLPEGEADELLEAMGILDRNHRVRPTMRDKFTQINEFLKLLEHALPEAMRQRGEHRQDADATVGKHRQDADATLLILDCGCGSSLLTLAAAHFLNVVKGISARVVGIDANSEVIEKSRARAAEVPGLRVEFRQAAIGAVADVRADIVLALHACDTATDDALVQAVRSEARLLLAVPCCHQHLNGRLSVPALAAIQHHGILHQRQADIVTDTFRALLLEVMGYRAEVIEFISAEHTARNLMIRAVRVREPGNSAAMARYQAFRSFAGVTPYLETALGGVLPASVGADL